MPLAAVDDAAGREVRALDELAQVGDRRRRGRPPGAPTAADHLAQVVRRDVGRHAHRDAARAVDQQVREPRGQDRRLLQPVVEVRAEVDGVLVDVGQHLDRDRASAAPRCTGTPPPGRRRPSRSSPGRRPADSAARSPAPCGPARRRPRCRRAGGTCRARRRRPSRDFLYGRARAPARARSSRRGCGGAPASVRRARRAARATR